MNAIWAGDLARWLRVLLLFQKNWIWFPAPTLYSSQPFLTPKSKGREFLSLASEGTLAHVFFTHVIQKRLKKINKSFLKFHIFLYLLWIFGYLCGGQRTTWRCHFFLSSHRVLLGLGGTCLNPTEPSCWCHMSWFFFMGSEGQTWVARLSWLAPL